MLADIEERVFDAAEAELDAIRALAAADGTEPLAEPPSAVRAMVAAAQAKVALAGPTGWDTILEMRNMLVDFINDEASRAGGEDGAVDYLKPAEQLSDELEVRLQSEECPARVQMALTLKLHVEGFEMSAYAAGLLQHLTGDPEPKSTAPAHDDAHAVERWNAVRDAFVVAEAESEKASDLEGDEEDSDRLKALYDQHKVIHRGWSICREVFLATPAPHWSALASKAVAVVAYADNARWVRAARDFIAAANEIGTVAPTDVDLIAVIKARGHAEQIAYYAANRPDGYAGFACGLGQVATMSSEIEVLVKESRTLGRANQQAAAMSGHIIGAVWFNEIHGNDRLSHVEALDDDFSEVIRTFQTLDDKRVRDQCLTSEEQTKLAKADARLDEIQDTAFLEPPLTRSGVAFQLLAASSMIDRVYGGATDEMRVTSADNIRTAIANAIRVMGLPFDYRAAQYFMGPQLDDLDGCDRGGPTK